MAEMTVQKFGKIIIGLGLLVVLILVFVNPLHSLGKEGVNGVKQLLGVGQSSSGIYGGQHSTIDSVSTDCVKNVITNPGVSVNKDYFGQLPCSARTGGISTIVLHHTGDTSAKTTINTLKNAGYSVHYIVDKDGTIYYLVDESKKAWHAGCRSGVQGELACISTPPPATNDNSIGIEIVNLGTSSDKYTAEQYTALNGLLRDIARRQGIAYDNNHLLAHYQISEGKWDPSPNFNWEEIGLYGHAPLSDYGTPPKIAGYP